MIKKWFRHLMASYIAKRANETGGYLFDYDNAKWRAILEWQGSTEESIEMIGNMINSGRDKIYVLSMYAKDSDDRPCGMIQVIDSECEIYERFWVDGLYLLPEAFVDTVTYLRKRALEMGWPPPQEQENVGL